MMLICPNLQQSGSALEVHRHGIYGSCSDTPFQLQARSATDTVVTQRVVSSGKGCRSQIASWSPKHGPRIGAYRAR